MVFDTSVGVGGTVVKCIGANGLLLAAGLLTGLALGSGGGARAAGGKEEAIPATFSVYVDGNRANITAYAINGTTFVRLVDVGQAVDFNVYWDGAANAVQVESDAPYLGKASLVNQQEKAREVEQYRNEIVRLTNEVRRSKGLKELEINRKLMEAAQVRATELAATTTYDHVRPDGSRYTTVTDSPYVGENLYRVSNRYMKQEGKTLPRISMDAWLTSSGHLSNILNNEVGGIGVGIAEGVNDKGEQAWYCVQLFLVDGCVITWVDTPKG
jgi:uncharacterized protein YkwD